MRSFGSLALAFVALVPWAPDLMAQEFPTEDDVERYVREVHRLVEVHGRGVLPTMFFHTLNQLGARYDLPAVALRDPSTSTNDQDVELADSLLRTLGPEAALEAAAWLDEDRSPSPWIRVRVAGLILERHGVRSLLDLTSDMDGVRLVSFALFRNASRDPAAVADTVRTWLTEGQPSSSVESKLYRDLLLWLLRSGVDGVVDEIRAARDAGVRAEGLWHVLMRSRASESVDPAALSEGLSAVFEMEPGSERARMLERYARLCENVGAAPCQEYELPVIPPSLTQRAIAFRNAVYSVELERADSLLAELVSDGLPEGSQMALVAEALAHGCSRAQACSYALAPLREAWLDRLKAFGETEGPQADTVRAALVRILAGPETGTAVRMLSAVQDSALATHTTILASQHAYPVDFWLAVEMLRLNAERGWGNRLLPPDMYPRLRSLGEDALAAELLASLDSDRMWHRLRWVKVLYHAGRIGQARREAMAALDHWDPEREPVSGVNYFRVYEQLDIYEDLISWAWAQPEGPRRAGALLSVLMGLRDIRGDL